MPAEVVLALVIVEKSGQLHGRGSDALDRWVFAPLERVLETGMASRLASTNKELPAQNILERHANYLLDPVHLHWFGDGRAIFQQHGFADEDIADSPKSVLGTTWTWLSLFLRYMVLERIDVFCRIIYRG